MTGDAREAAEVALLAKLSALTTANGLPANFNLITRELHHFSELAAAQLPACLLQMEEPEVIPQLSHRLICTLPARVVVLYAPDTTLPATLGNQYRQAIEKAIMSDVHLGGKVDSVTIRGTLMPGIWEGTHLYGVGILLNILYEYDARLEPMTA